MAKQIVIFDLDGTITYHDTFIPFLWGCFKCFPRLNVHLFRLPLQLLLFWTKFISAKQFKEELLTAFLGGLPLNSVDAWTENFALSVVTKKCRPCILERINMGQQNGDRLLIVSASPDFYVKQIARHLGILETIATEIEIKEGCFTGKIVGANCAGPEKLRRVQFFLGSDISNFTIEAYGDRPSDLFLLRWVHSGWLLKRNAFIRV